jgi:hypothetical protein
MDEMDEMARTLRLLHRLWLFGRVFLVAYIRMQGVSFLRYCIHHADTRTRMSWLSLHIFNARAVVRPCSVTAVGMPGCAAHGVVSLAFWDAFALGAKSALLCIASNNGPGGLCGCGCTARVQSDDGNLWTALQLFSPSTLNPHHHLHRPLPAARCCIPAAHTHTTTITIPTPFGLASP